MCLHICTYVDSVILKFHFTIFWFQGEIMHLVGSGGNIVFNCDYLIVLNIVSDKSF